MELKISKIKTSLENGVLIGTVHQHIHLAPKGQPTPIETILNSLIPKTPIYISGDFASQRDAFLEFLHKLVESNLTPIIIEMKADQIDKEIIHLVDFVTIILDKSLLSVDNDVILSNISECISLHSQVQVKAKIQSKEEIEKFATIFECIHDGHPYVPLVFSPLDDSIVNKLKDYIIENKMEYVKVIPKVGD